MTGEPLPRGNKPSLWLAYGLALLAIVVTMTTVVPDGFLFAARPGTTRSGTARPQAASAQATSTTTVGGSTSLLPDIDEPPDPTPRDEVLRLVDQSDWVSPESTFSLTLAVNDNIQPDSRLAVRFYDKVSGRIRFSESIEGDGLGQPIQPLLKAVPLSEIARDSEGHLVFDIPVSATSVPEFGVRLISPGVFPVSVAITDAAGRELSSFVTHLIRIPDGEISGPRLAVTVVLPMQAPPAQQPGDAIEFSEPDINHLNSIANALSDNPTLPLTLTPTPETIDALDKLASTEGDKSELYKSIINAFRDAAAGRQIVSSPYVPVDLGSWIDSGMDEWLDRQLTQGTSTLTTALGTKPDGASWVADASVTPEALDVLYSKGVRQIVMPTDNLSDPPAPWSDVTFTNTFDVMTADGSLVRAVGADSELASRLESTPDPVLNAHLALADLAVLYYDRPSRSRAVALLLPSDAALPQATLDAFFGGLEDSSLISPVTMNDLFRVTDPAGTTGVADDDGEVLERNFTSDPPVDLVALHDDLNTTDAQLAGLRSMIGETSGVIAPVENRLLIAGSKNLDRATSHKYLEGAVDQIDAITSGVATPPRQVVTLTARSAKIPLSIDNHLSYPVNVKVHLVSEKLVFPDGDIIDVTLPAASTTRLEISVEARASGAFPVDVNLTSPENSLDLGSTRLTLRSTAISGLGLALSISAGLFLAIWWLRNFRRTRRARRLIESDHEPAIPGSIAPDAVELQGVTAVQDQTASPDQTVSYAPADHD